jgi:endonuclease/exonuclease/phosphatase family metal-dependent hydrolase
MVGSPGEPAAPDGQDSTGSGPGTGRRRRGAITGCGIMLWLIAAVLGASALPVAGAEPEITVMTYNLRYASDTPPNAWAQRRPVMKACVESVKPEVFGTQEGLYRQLKDLAADLPAYDWIGTGRDGGSRGEFMAVFYRRERLEPLEFDHFWLSDTPAVIGSSTWGNTNRRMVTWVRFRDRLSGAEFYFWNTHLDHALQPAREKGAALIRDRVRALNTKLPVLLVGDFNATAGANPAYDLLVKDGDFRDTWHLAAERFNADYNTFTRRACDPDPSSASARHARPALHRRDRRPPCRRPGRAGAGSCRQREGLVPGGSPQSTRSPRFRPAAATLP